MEFLDCRGCSKPLRPPVFQCSLGHPHFLCSSCCEKLPESKCKTCSGTAFRHCSAMDDTISSILLPCKHGCDENIAYYRKEGHEKVCREGPCFCPEPDCGFRRQTAQLFDHFTTHHSWPATRFEEHRPFDLPARPGIHVLHDDGGHLFLLNVASLESHALTASLVSVQANTEEPIFGFSFSYKWRSYHSQPVWLDKITSSSLSDGFPEDYFCILPSVLGADTPLLECIFITKEVDDEDGMEWDEDDVDDSTSDEDEDDEADDHSD
ncbi:unnamed protein product [Alopecurus aequalis]